MKLPERENYNNYIKWGYITLLLAVYIPLLIFGGFGTADDLAVLVYEETSTAAWRTELEYSFTRPAHIARPIHALAQVVTLFIFKDIPILYTIFRLLLWGIGLYCLVKAFGDLLGTLKTKLFIFLYSFPIFTSAHFFNCFQTGYLFALIFWSLSLYVIKGTYSQTGPSRFGWSSFFLMLSLLSCEIMFPLFLLNIGLPILYTLKHPAQKKSLLELVVKNKQVYIVFIICVVFLVFKLWIASVFKTEEGVYGVGLSTESFLQALYYIPCLLIEIPLLLLEVVPYLLVMPVIGLLLAFLPLTFFLFSTYRGEVALQDAVFFKWLPFLFAFTLFSCAIIFFLSGYPSVTYGHYNKMLLPSFVLICFLLTYLLSYFLKKGGWLPVGLFCFLWVASMVIQIKHFNESWSIRKEILTDNAKVINETSLGDNPIVLSNVPYFLENNYNNDHVFWLSWDFSDGLKYFGLNKEVNTIPFCWQTLFDEDYFPEHNVNTLLIDHPSDNLWVYEYDLTKKQSIIKRISTLDNYKAEQVTRKLNYHPLIPRARIRQFLKKTIKSKS